MNLENIKRRALASWATVGVLAILCLVLASLQYVWIGEISRAERARLKDGLQSALQRLALDVNGEVNAAVAAIRPTQQAFGESGREDVYAAHWLRWRESSPQPGLFRRAALVIPEGNNLKLLLFDETAERFIPAEWPSDWTGMEESLLSRLRERRGGPSFATNSALLDLPRFVRREDDPGPPSEVDWLILELNLDYFRDTHLPAMLNRHIGTGMAIHARLVNRVDRTQTIFESGVGSGAPPEATVSLIDVNPFDFGRRGGGGFRKDGGGRREFKGGGGPPQAMDFNRGRWQLEVHYAEGTLDNIVARLRWRNLGISLAILALMLLTAVLLVRFSREQQQLAELQMNFVASVSHELRTPLTVIRTAAFNLRGRVAADPARVERYGTLIQDESEKLTALVEQVLRFSSARAGHAVGERSPVAVEGVIDEALHSRRLGVPGSRIVVEKNLEDGLPLVMADEMALKHAIQNLLDNAVKYGTENSDWIGVSARRVAGANGDAVEVRIADRGPGIPAAEQANVFNAFFRGRRAQQDQIHGTGLGLNLVKRIVEAHQGDIRLHCEPGSGAEFIIRIPAAPAELQDEFAHTSG